MRIRQLLAALSGMRDVKVVGKMSLFPYLCLSGLAFALKRAGIVSTKFPGQSGGEFPVPFPVKADLVGREPIVRKSVESLVRQGPVLEVPEDAIAIHVLRHLCGYISSVLRGEAAHRYGLTIDALCALSSEEWQAWRWALVNEKAVDDARASGRVKVVSYDALWRNPEEVGWEEMFAFVDLNCRMKAARIVGQRAPNQERGYYSVFKNPLRVVTRWRQKLKPVVIRRIMGVVANSQLGKTWFADDLAG